MRWLRWHADRRRLRAGVRLPARRGVRGAADQQSERLAQHRRTSLAALRATASHRAPVLLLSLLAALTPLLAGCASNMPPRRDVVLGYRRRAARDPERRAERAGAAGRGDRVARAARPGRRVRRAPRDQGPDHRERRRPHRHRRRRARPDVSSPRSSSASGARWQDGEPITADDVRFAFDDDRAAPPSTARRWMADRVERVDRIDDRTRPLHVPRGRALGSLSTGRARAAAPRSRGRDRRRSARVRARADARRAVRRCGVDPGLRDDAQRVSALRPGRAGTRSYRGAASTATAARSSTRCAAVRSMLPARPRSRPISRERSTASPTARAFRRSTSRRTRSGCCASERKERCSRTSASVARWSSRSTVARWSRRSSPAARACRAPISSRRCRRRRSRLRRRDSIATVHARCSRPPASAPAASASSSEAPSG